MKDSSLDDKCSQVSSRTGIIFRVNSIYVLKKQIELVFEERLLKESVATSCNIWLARLVIRINFRRISCDTVSLNICKNHAYMTHIVINIICSELITVRRSDVSKKIPRNKLIYIRIEINNLVIATIFGQRWHVVSLGMLNCRWDYSWSPSVHSWCLVDHLRKVSSCEQPKLSIRVLASWRVTLALARLVSTFTKMFILDSSFIVLLNEFLMYRVFEVVRK